MDEEQYLGLRESEALQLMRLEDTLYQEGFSEKEINDIITKKVAHFEAKRMMSKKPTLTSLVLGCALGISLAVGAGYLFSNCSSLNELKSDKTEQNYHSKGNMRKSAPSGYGVE